VDSDAPDEFSRSSRDLIGWKWGFLVLAVRRGHSLLQHAAAPESVARSPNVAAEHATAFLLSLQDLRLEPGAQGDYWGAVRALVRETFAELKNSIGDAPTKEIREWLGRNFVDRDEKMRLWMWSILLPRLAAVYGTAPSQAPPVPEDTMRRFERIVGTYFSHDLARVDDELAARARAEPLTEAERALLRVHGPSIQELEQPVDERRAQAHEGTASSEVEEVDVVDLLIATARRERARKAWQEIERLLTPRERTMLVVWARQEGSLRNLPVALIATRSAEN
jgi:hypothetical protein